jgi:GT2 family glycosyltransferase
VDRAAPLPSVAIILVNWNDAEATNACLDSLAAIPDARARPYVVDNASGDGSPIRIAAAHPEAILLQSAANLGYAGGFNLGRARALADGADYLWLLNNDTTVAPDCLAGLLEADRRIGPAVISPKILYQDRPGVIWYAGGALDRALKSSHIGEDEPDRGQHDRLRPVAWATGCSLFCSAEVARRVGPMDERYFLYLEDVDWCLRARDRGVPIYYAPAARVYHAVSRSVGQLPTAMVRYYAWRNYYLLAHRHGRWRCRARAYADLASRLVKIGLRQAFCPAYRRDAWYHARTLGLVDFLLGRFGPGTPPAPTTPWRGPAREASS